MSTVKEIKKLYELLFEMATGNLLVRLEKTEHENINEVINLLQKVAETMQRILEQEDFVRPMYSYQNLIQYTIILDLNGDIVNFNQTIIDLLNYSAKEFSRLNINDILTENSRELWETIKKEIEKNSKYQEEFTLIFKTKDNLVAPTFCCISRQYYTTNIFVNAVTTVLQDLKDETKTKVDAITKNTDSQIIQKVYDFIINNLEEPLPSTQELAKQFGMNEFTLKDSFKHFYNTSIYQLYNDERLIKAHNLIQKTNISLKEISYLSGFNDYTNFFKAFKKKYNYPPSKLKRCGSEDAIDT